MNLKGPRPGRTPDAKPAATVPEALAGAAERPPHSLIGKDMAVTGNIHASTDLHVDGRIEGDVKAATLVLGENGFIKGNVVADRFRIAGTIEGSIAAKELALDSTARVSGEVVYERMRIAAGGTIEGKIRRKSAEAASGSPSDADGGEAAAS